MNLEDIARLSGTSRSTVSRVINDDPRVKDSTRQRVLQVIQEVNYRPNVAARGLASGRTRVIGLVIPVEVSELFSDPYFPLLIQGITAVCNAQDHMLMLWLADPAYERQVIRQILNASLVDGVLVAAALIHEPILDALLTSDIPCVVVGQHTRLDASHVVDVENRAGARTAVRHLLGLGRRRIATITGPGEMVAGADRLQGYLDALAEAGLPQVPEWIVTGDFSEASGYAAMERLLPLGVDAVFAANDMMAIGAMHAVFDAGLRTPEDVAVVGFDDVPLASQVQPPLTTVRQSIQHTGEVAAELLIERIQQPDLPPRRVILPTELVVRASCGAGNG